MGTAERRSLILKTLCRRRHETITNLAEEFNVSERTIRRDIELLSMSEPIYTLPGRYNGGVYVVDGYYIEKNYFSNAQLEVVEKLIDFAEKRSVCLLDTREISSLKDMIQSYAKPCLRQ